MFSPAGQPTLHGGSRSTYTGRRSRTGPANGRPRRRSGSGVTSFDGLVICPPVTGKPFGLPGRVQQQASLEYRRPPPEGARRCGSGAKAEVPESRTRAPRVDRTSGLSFIGRPDPFVRLNLLIQNWSDDSIPSPVMISGAID